MTVPGRACTRARRSGSMNPCLPRRSPPRSRWASGCVSALANRYGGYANRWGFAIYLASKDGYEDSILPSGYPVGTAEEALDCACGLYLNDPTAWHTE